MGRLGMRFHARRRKSKSLRKSFVNSHLPMTATLTPIERDSSIAWVPPFGDGKKEAEKALESEVIRFAESRI